VIGPVFQFFEELRPNIRLDILTPLRFARQSHRSTIMAPQDPGRPDDKPEGLSKYIKRMKTVLRPRSGSKRQSIAAQPDVGQSSQSAYVISIHLLPPPSLF